jgi:hypothetical protein
MRMGFSWRLLKAPATNSQAMLRLDSPIGPASSFTVRGEIGGLRQPLALFGPIGIENPPPDERRRSSGCVCLSK